MREIIARRFNVLVSEPDRFVSVAADPSLKQPGVLLGSSFHTTRRQQMHTYVTLRECVKSIEYFCGNRLKARHNQRDVKRAIQISGFIQFTGG